MRRLRIAALALGCALIAGAWGPNEAPLADAAMKRDSVLVRQLLKQGADVNASQGDGMTALHWAAVNGDASMARVLVVAGARLEAATRNGNYTPLHLAARAGRAAVAQALLDAGANVNAATTSGGARPLHFAASQGDVATMQVLLARGATVDVRESAFEQTPLMWAAANDRAKAIDVLVRAGASLKAMSRVEDTPAMDKAQRQALGLRSRRVAALKAAEQPPRPAGATGQPSDSSVRRAAPQVARRDSAAAPTRQDSTLTPQQRAAEQDSARIRDSQGRALGYSDLVGNRGGLTPLLFAVRQGSSAAVKTLIECGAAVNEVSAGDHTSPLLMATINGHFDLAKYLLDKGADPKLASDAGATPLYTTINTQWAAKSLYPQPTAQAQQHTTHLELMELLLKAGADPNARLTKHLWYMSYNFDLLGVNTQGASPFWRAAYGLDLPAMKLLLKYGADPKVPTTKPAGRALQADAPAEEDSTKGDPSGLPPVAAGGPGVYPIHAASGVGYGEGFAANSHRHAPDAWIPAVKFLVEELGADVNARDLNGFTPLHHAAARGDDELIQYLMSKGADIAVVSRRGQTVADMANGPVQRIPPFLETVKLLEKLGSKNSHKCKSC